VTHASTQGFTVNGRPNKSASVENKQSDHVTQTIEEILKLESLDRTRTERIADSITSFFGSNSFIWLHVIWFSLWIIFDLPEWGFAPFDPFPFTFLTMVVSLEAIFLSAFILMSENRQGRLTDRRARVNLQVDMIAEREITKLMKLVMDIHSQLGIQKPVDDELENMQKPTNIEHLTQAAQTAEDQNNVGSSAKKIL
jgi:uncharacterized membrane protein